jgi:predicted RNase H-like nuclease (RuvC/YqgF family)
MKQVSQNSFDLDAYISDRLEKYTAYNTRLNREVEETQLEIESLEGEITYYDYYYSGEQLHALIRDLRQAKTQLENLEELQMITQRAIENLST